MNAEGKKILHWSLGGGVVALLIDWMVSGTQPMATRVTVGIMCGLAGFVTGGLLAANFAKDHGDEPESPAAGPAQGNPPQHH